MSGGSTVKEQMQDKLLNYLRKGKIESKIYLVNGVQVKGLIRSFDDYTVLVEDGRQQSMVYKHAISTIIPSEHVKMEEVMVKEAVEGEEGKG